MASDGQQGTVDLDHYIRKHAENLFEKLYRKDLEKEWSVKLEWKLLRKDVKKDWLHVQTKAVKYKHKFRPGSAVMPGDPRALVMSEKEKEKQKEKEKHKKANAANDVDEEEGTEVKKDNSQGISKMSNRSLFRTVYKNTTDCEQRYTMSTERSTMQSVALSFSKSIATSVGGGISLSLPEEILSISSGFSKEVTSGRSAEECCETSVSWSINSEVTVPPHTATTAELVLLEYEFQTSFVASISLSGRVSVSVFAPPAITSRLGPASSGASDAVEIAQLSFDIRDVVKYLSWAGFKEDPEDKESVIYEVEGASAFRFGTEQKVVLTQEKI